MNSKSNIGPWQIFSLMLISRLLSTITFMPVSVNNVGSSDYILSIAVGSISLLFVSLPVILIIKREKGLIEISDTISHGLSRFIASIYALFFLTFVISTLIKMNLFVSSVVFTQKSTALFMLLSIFAACCASSYGLEAIGRAGTVSLFLFISSFILILFSLRERIDPNNLSPLLYDTAKPVLNVILSVTIRTFEPAIMLFVLPKISKSALKSYIYWILSFSIMAVIIIAFLMLSLGDAALLQLFPIHSMTVLSQFSVFERMDALLIGMWILSAFIKVSFLIFLITELFGHCFKSVGNKVITAALGVIISLIVLVEAASITFFKITASTVFGSAAFLIFIVIIPTFFLLKGVKK